MKKYIKNTKWFLLSILLVPMFLLVSCSSDEQGGAEHLEDILKNYQSGADKNPDSPDVLDFAFEDKEDNEIRLSSFHGKPMVLNMWATWCPPCRAEMPHLKKVYEEKKDDVEFIFLDMLQSEKGSDKKLVEAFLEENDLKDLPVYYDAMGEGYKYFNARAIPVTYVFDEKGNLAHYYIGGFPSEDAFKAFLDEAFEKMNQSE